MGRLGRSEEVTNLIKTYSNRGITLYQLCKRGYLVDISHCSLENSVGRTWTWDSDKLYMSFNRSEYSSIFLIEVKLSLPMFIHGLLLREIFGSKTKGDFLYVSVGTSSRTRSESWPQSQRSKYFILLSYVGCLINIPKSLFFSIS